MRYGWVNIILAFTEVFMKNLNIRVNFYNNKYILQYVLDVTILVVQLYYRKKLFKYKMVHKILLHKKNYEEKEKYLNLSTLGQSNYS